MKALLAALTIATWMPASDATDLPCSSSTIIDGFLSDLPDYDNGVGVTDATGQQAELYRGVSACARNYPFCAVTTNDRVLKGRTQSDISVKSKSLVFGLQQTFVHSGRSYCVIGARVGPYPGGDYWWMYSIEPELGRAFQKQRRIQALR